MWITTNCGILKHMGIPDHLTCLLRNLYAGQEATVRTRHEQWTGSKLGKEYIKAVYCHPAYLTNMQRTSWEMPAGWLTTWNQDCQEKYQQLKYVDNTTLKAEKEEKLKSLLMKVQEDSEKAGLKLIQKTKIIASSSITSWQIDGETMERVADFIFLGPKITSDSDCSHKIKNCLLLGRKAMTNLDITLPTKVCIVKAMFFPVVMYGCESWAIKKAEHLRIDAFRLWCWKRLLRVPWLQGDQISQF